MNPAEIRIIVDKHAEKYRNSCSASLAEMLLKIEGAVSTEYYAEQHRDKEGNVGLRNIKNQSTAGYTFQRLQDIPSSKTLSERIDELLGSGHQVGIYTEVKPVEFHGFVIAGKQDNKYVLLTKQSELGG